MPQPFPQPRHPDDTPDRPTPVPDILRTDRYDLDPTRDATTSPLRRALRAAFLHRSPRHTKEN